MPDTEKEKIDQTDKMDDTKKADDLEAEAKKDKESEEAAAEKSEKNSDKKEEKSEDRTSQLVEEFKAQISELQGICGAQSKRIDELEKRIIEVSSNKSSSEDNNLGDTGFIAM